MASLYPHDAVGRAVAALADGLPVLVVDDESRENEGDVVLAAATATPEWTAWMIRNTSGLVCAPMRADRTEALALPQMVADNRDPKRTAYTVTVDARTGVSTGISAADRTRTLRVLADPRSHADDLIRPGHVLPLRAVDGGVVERAGHTEAAVELCELAGLPPVGAIAELTGDDGAMLRMPAVEELGARMDLPVLSIAELIRYRQIHPRVGAPRPPRVRRVAVTGIDTRHGRFDAIGYRDSETGDEHIALMRGGSGPVPLVRVHSECLTGEAFGSHRCECGPQLDAALARIASSGGIVVYLRGHEGRGIGLLKKLAAYRLQDEGLDTVQANVALGEPVDAREYGAAAAILQDLGCAAVELMTNNPAKIAGLESAGIRVHSRVPHFTGAIPGNVRYLRTKRERMGHLIPVD
ncbi:3,4-dihydroxy-2-butanone-4-phosphate synthase [Nocardia higoensis]|uniref:3,4-dihydroxy-2-butanone-4-phosphate synthase n=1 Tax=Nocardia higoensis TaxID=228599 RepID=UPI0003008E1A|nr:3,4-dihydroxy-2-butanone-4-phosphate synthase [Nocardia higoensis]